MVLLTVALQPVAMLGQAVAALVQPLAVLLQAVLGPPPLAAPRSTESCQWNCPEMHKVMQGGLAKAKKFFHASVDSVADTEHHKADC